ncbi:MAG: hypothetical protein IPN70_02795 [Candidatus Moraniibacteriota bacterium]|nr:MAG: hypothetical protein IPN70_02795 [Candidatus Moranbacteria bacterium]
MRKKFKKKSFLHFSLPVFSGIFLFLFFSFSSPTHASTVTWTGTTSTAWTTVTNWNTGTVPTSTDDVVINYTGTNQPTLDVNGGTITIQSLTLGGGASTSTLTLSYGSPTNKFIVTGNVTILDKGYLTHPFNDSVETHRLFMDVGGNLDVQTGGQINVDGKGYSGGPGFGTYGGSYGGQSATGGTMGITYGSYLNPENIGSGGTSISGAGSVILNVTGSVFLNGSITTIGSDRGASAGSGGSVNISTTTFSGAGVIKANGGGANGGGGRVAVKLTSGNDFGSVTMQAYGTATGTIYTETASQGSGNGTVIIDNNNRASSVFTVIPSTQTWTIKNLVLRNKGQISVPTGTTLILDNPNSVTGLAGSSAIDSGIALRGGTFDLPQGLLNIENWALIADLPHTLNGDIIVKSGGYMTHSANGSTELYKMNLTINGNLDVQTGGQINVDGKGYSGGPGFGTYGGSYGGQSATGGTMGITYGSYLNPENIGSGGTSISGAGSVILNVTGSVFLNGSITTIGSDRGASAGSGGSVNISTTTFSGAGVIKANGGGANGGGGRVAVKLTSGNDFGSVTMQAYGTATGTIYTETASQGSGNGTVIIDNNNRASSVFTVIPSTQTWTIKNLVLRNKGQISVPTGTTLDLTNATITNDGLGTSGINVNGGTLLTPETVTVNGIFLNITAPQTINGNLILGGGSTTSTLTVSNGSPTNKFTVTGNVTIANNGYLTHTANTNAETHRLFMDVGGNLDVQIGGKINVDGRGYGAGYGPGICKYNNTFTASYGGNNIVDCGGFVYGSLYNPVNLGTGGNNNSGGGIYCFECC